MAYFIQVLFLEFLILFFILHSQLFRSFMAEAKKSLSLYMYFLHTQLMIIAWRVHAVRAPLRVSTDSAYSRVAR